MTDQPVLFLPFTVSADRPNGERLEARVDRFGAVTVNGNRIGSIVRTLPAVPQPWVASFHYGGALVFYDARLAAQYLLQTFVIFAHDNAQRPRKDNAPMNGPGATKCSKCGADIFMRKHYRTGNFAPLDAVPDPEGNCILVGLIDERNPQTNEMGYRVLTKQDRARMDAGEYDPVRYTNHFQTCPQAATFRRSK